MTDEIKTVTHAKKPASGENTEAAHADISNAAVSAPYLDSSALAAFKKLITAFPALQGLGNDMLQYTVVIDANIAVSDILHKYRNPHLRQTAIEEAIASSVLRIHAPRWLDTEMTASTIPQVALDKGLPESELLNLWVAYRELLVWDDSLNASGDVDDRANDPKDVPYVYLQNAIAAAGILTRDKDIERLGGRALTLDFVFLVRKFARAETYCVGIRLGGTMVGYITIAALVDGVRGLLTLVSRLPPWAKIGCLLGMLVVVLHPQLRAKVLSFLEDACSATKIIWPELKKLIDLMQEKQIEADAARESVALVLRS